MYSEVIKQELSKDSSVVLAILYGSAANERIHLNSDIDLAVATNAPLTKEKKIEIITRLTLTLDREIDLVDLNEISGLILQEVLCKGKLLINNSSEKFAELIKQMLYDQADWMPYVNRILDERTRKFCYG